MVAGSSPANLTTSYTGRMRIIDYSEVMVAVTPSEAVDAVRRVLIDGFDPATDPQRQKVGLPHGEMHLLPSALDGAVGVKVLGIQPAGSTVDVPLVQGSYLLMGGETLTPEMVMDAAALTEIRTPAVAVAGVWDRLRASSEPLECVIVGAGVRFGVVSDIDDTALAKIHETRYPRGTVIPGIIAFYEALDLGPRDAPLSRGDLTFVTARPADALGLMKSYSRESLTKAGFADLSIMTGSIFHLATHDAMAAKKVANIAHYATLFPEYDLVFVGDSGQGDIAVGEQILQAHGDVVKAVFIHDVVALDAGRRAELAAKGIWVVDTYVGAAAKAHELGLISEAGVQRVIDETHRLLDDVEWESSEQERAMRELVERDASGR